MHALLFQNWKNRVKGRDWYDLEWYTKKEVPIHLNHFVVRALDSGHWKEKTISKGSLKQLLISRIDTVYFKGIKDHIQRFIPDKSVIAIWSTQ
jgi:hypothetical protein